MNHKFDESHICVACGHSQGWAEKWQVFECVPEAVALEIAEQKFCTAPQTIENKN